MENKSLAVQTFDRDDYDEQVHLTEVMNSFRQHATFARSARKGHLMRIRKLPDEIRSLLPVSLRDEMSSEYKQRQKIAETSEIRNQFFFDSMLKYTGVEHSQEHQPLTIADLVSDENFSKTYSVLKSLAREWSVEGNLERQQCFSPILNAIHKYVKAGSRISVPGAGLGRLAVEIFSLGKGYHVQGNEFGFHMLLCSDFILNACSNNQQFVIHPYSQQYLRNTDKFDDAYRGISIPDTNPSTLVSAAKTTTTDSGDDPEFSMAAGDFASIYSNDVEHGRWNCVACSFFLDAAPCIVQYLQIIYDMLEEGGLLISFGPLHYHWTGPDLRPGQSIDEYQEVHSNLDKRYLNSVDLCWDDVRTVMNNIGFNIIEESAGHEAFYTRDSKSFQSIQYSCIFVVARK